MVRQISQLLDTCSDDEIAAEMNRRGCRTGMKQVFTRESAQRIRCHYGLKSRYDRLREKGLYTADEMAAELGVTRQTVAIWYRHGLLKGYEYNHRGERLYEMPPQEHRPKKQQGLWGKLTKRTPKTPFASHAANEVHHES